MIDLDSLFDSLRDVAMAAMATNFRAKFKYQRLFGTAAFQNGLQYRHSDLKLSNSNILATFFTS